MWYGSLEYPYSHEAINKNISESIESIIGDFKGSYDFAWYVLC